MKSANCATATLIPPDSPTVTTLEDDALRDERRELLHLRKLVRIQQEENEELQMKLTQSNEQLEDYRAQIAQLEKSQSTLKSTTDASADESKKRNQQIDQIVREIENCIDQLKQ